MWRVTLVVAVCWAGLAAAQVPLPYDRGINDRIAYERWATGLGGDYKAGAEFYTANRGRPSEASCSSAAVIRSVTWRAGCLDAKRMLDPADQARKSDPDYRRGWNDFSRIRDESSQPSTQASAAMARTVIDTPQGVMDLDKVETSTHRSGYEASLLNNCGQITLDDTVKITLNLQSHLSTYDQYSRDMLNKDFAAGQEQADRAVRVYGGSICSMPDASVTGRVRQLIAGSRAATYVDH